jgi:hypothetical protein
MSKAFTREADADQQSDLPERAIPPYPNLVTAEGLAQIEEALTRLTEQHDDARAAGDAAATASNIAASETMFRLGIACNLISQILFMWVALALYDLLKGVNRRHASLMLGLILVSLPIALLNELNSIAALILVRGADFLSLFDKPQRDALAMLFLNLHGQGFGIAEIFWGLWLFPLGLLVYRSGFFPRILGVLLIVNCFTYLVNSFTFLLLPRYVDIVSRWTKPLGRGEMLFMFWILIIGAIPKPVAGPLSSAAVG